MNHNPFSIYYTARKLESFTAGQDFLPVFSSSDIKVYPFQVAAAGFAVGAKGQNGVILCDESGMGKSHEALLLIAQYFYQGKTRALLLVPNADLLEQWITLIEDLYSFPYFVVTAVSDLDKLDEDVTILTTYDFATQNSSMLNDKYWDLMVFEESTALASVYKDENKQAKILKTLGENSFKVLLTGTPIEKNIMDLYGLLYFIDESILPSEQEFLKRFFRKPENYPELSKQVSPYCFRTLRHQAKQYAKIPERRNIALEFSYSPEEQEIYDLLYQYCNKEDKIAFPSMDSYDLSLKILGTYSSSSYAVTQTLKGVLKRLDELPDSEKKQVEAQEISRILCLLDNVTLDEKTKKMLSALESGFRSLKKVGAKEKAVIFTESVQTQSYLAKILEQFYSISLYNGSADYSAIQKFKKETQILISSDHGARGFNLEEVSFLIQYDLLYNTLKMEQRIDRCHRLGQDFDVISLCFVNTSNLSDVRKIELVNKRIAVSEGVLGLSDNVVGGFTEELDFQSLHLPTKESIQLAFEERLKNFETENKEILSQAEDILFTTFTPELANRLKISPNYIMQESDYLNDNLWEVARWFFQSYNQNNSDCFFEIDDENKVITATNYETLPVLFYYYNGSQNRKYVSQKQYGMAKDFKPRHGRISLTSIIGRGVINESICNDTGKIFVDNQEIPPCHLALYTVSVIKGREILGSYPVFVGKTLEGATLCHEDCQKILATPQIGFEMEGGSPCWLKYTSKPHSLDHLLDVSPYLAKHHTETEVETQLRSQYARKKASLTHELEDFRIEIKKLEDGLKDTTDRMEKLKGQRTLNLKKQDMKKQEEQLFFREMELDVELEEKIKEQTGELVTKVVRQFVVEVTHEQK